MTFGTVWCMKLCEFYMYFRFWLPILENWRFFQALEPHPGDPPRHKTKFWESWKKFWQHFPCIFDFFKFFLRDDLIQESIINIKRFICRKSLSTVTFGFWLNWSFGFTFIAPRLAGWITDFWPETWPNRYWTLPETIVKRKH